MRVTPFGHSVAPRGGHETSACTRTPRPPPQVPLPPGAVDVGFVQVASVLAATVRVPLPKLFGSMMSALLLSNFGTTGECVDVNPERSCVNRCHSLAPSGLSQRTRLL